MLLGREQELGRLNALLTAARAGVSDGLMIEGEPGVGKTALLDFAIETADGMLVLTARGVESESQLAFSGLSELLGPLADNLNRLPEMQAQALRGVLGIAPAPKGGLAVGAATLAALAMAAEEAAVLVAVDDVHWLDAASAQALLFATRRMKAEGVVVLLTGRSDEQHGAPFRGKIPAMEVHGLDLEPAIALLARTDREVNGTVAAELVAATRGNPLALLELPGLLTAAELTGTEPLERPLPVGAGLKLAFSRRLELLPPTTRELLLVVAASRTASVGPIARAGELLDLPTDAVSPAEDAGLLRASRARFTFRHPLLRSVIYHGASAEQRRRAHAALAEALAHDGNTEERIWHLAAATLTPDEHVAGLLEEVAASARDRGAYGAAGSAAEHSARLSPQSSDRARRLLEAAGDLRFVAQFERSLGFLDEAEVCTDEPARRAEIKRLRAWIHTWSGEYGTAGTMYLEAVAEIESDDPARAAQILAEAASLWAMVARPPKMLELAERAYQLAEGLDGGAGSGPAAIYGAALVLSGRANQAQDLELLDRRRLGVDDGQLLADPTLVNALGHSPIWCERYEDARSVLEPTIALARASSAVAILPFPLACLASLEFRCGRWLSAYTGALESVQLAEQTAQHVQLAHSLSVLATIEAGLGHAQECRDHSTSARDRAAKFSLNAISLYAGTAVGALELGLGQPVRSIEHLAPAQQLSRDLGCAEPGVLWSGANLVEAYQRAGRPSDARRELAALEHEAQVTGRIWAIATSARCRGILADGDGFEEHFTQALELHDGLEAPFERARTELCFGARLRSARRGPAARLHLRSALETFDRLDAAPWALQARDELRAAGERLAVEVRRGVARRLTPQELQVAHTVAQGATNREAAAALFLSPKTIEFHLSNVYRKLHVRSRSEMVRALLADSSARAHRSGGDAAAPGQLERA